MAGGEVVAIYDWDSVCIEPELFAVATSSVTFCVDWSRPVGEHFPTNAEMRAFIAEYEAARGAPFSDEHRGLLAARIVYGLCYGARCEHADNYPEVADSQQGLLRRLGDALLDRRTGGARRAGTKRTGVADAARGSGGHAGSECEGALGGGLDCKLGSSACCIGARVDYLISLMMLNIGR